MSAVKIGYEERSFGALYFSFGIGIGTLALRWVLFDVATSIFGPLTLEQTLLLTLFIGSFIGSILYSLRVDLIIERITHALVSRKFRRTGNKAETNILDIAYVDIMCHAWDSEIWETIENDSKLAVKDAIIDPAIQSLFWNIKAGTFSSISILLGTVALYDFIPSNWHMFLIVVTLFVFIVPVYRNYDVKLIAYVAKMKWCKEGIEKVIHKKETGTSLDLGIALEKLKQQVMEINEVLAKVEYESFKRHSEILISAIRKFGSMTGKTYVDSVLANYLYRAVVRDHSHSEIRTQSDYCRLYKEIRRLFHLTGSAIDSHINWDEINTESQLGPSIFFRNVPLDVFEGPHVLDKSDILRDIIDLIRYASEMDKIEYLNSIGDTLVRYNSRLPAALKGALFTTLNGAPDLLLKVGDSIVAGMIKDGFGDEFQKLTSPEMVTRFVKITSSQDLLDYVGKEALEAILRSIFILVGVKSESKDEVRRHKSVYSRMGMGKLLDALEKNH